MENPDLVLQETGSRPTYSQLNYVPSGDTLRRDAISSSVYFSLIYFIIDAKHVSVQYLFQHGQNTDVVFYHFVFISFIFIH